MYKKQQVRPEGKRDIHISSTGPHWYPLDPSMGKIHRDAGPPKWKYICVHFQCGGPASRCIHSSPKKPADDQTNRHKITRGPWTTVQTDGFLILSLRVFEPVACGGMRCMQLWAAQINFYCLFKSGFPNKNPYIIYIQRKISLFYGGLFKKS